MDYRNFRLQIIGRVLLLAVNLYFLLLLDFKPQYTGTGAWLSGLLLIQLVLLIRYLEKSHQALNKFLDSIHYDDFTETFSPRGEGTGLDGLHRKLNQVMHKFREIRAEKEADAHYYRTVVHHVGTGILSYKKTGEIHLCNAAAKKLLQISQPDHIRHLQLEDPQGTAALLHLQHGERTLVKLVRQGQPLQLAVNAIDVLLRGEEYRILSIQNIQEELDDKEMEAWQNLIKVLTHEIMNSVTPISSLAASTSEELSDLLEAVEEKPVRPDDLQDLEKALYTIRRRSEGLVHFVSNFRNLTQVPQPDIKPVDLPALWQRIALLMDSQLQAHHVQLILEQVPPGLNLLADEHLLEQVLINLVQNAIQALQDQGGSREVRFSAYQNPRSRLIVEVTDNGPGINKVAAEKIFIPFYTTKKTGSGIGLSWSKQIMRLHNGTISVHSPVGGGCVFRLQF